MFKSPYPLEAKKQTNGDIIISDGFLCWKKEIRINPDSDKITLTVHGLFKTSVIETNISELTARTEPTTVCSGSTPVSGIDGVLCIHDTRIIYTKGSTEETVMSELNVLNEQLNNKLNIVDGA